jgi:hypothetical protein
MLIQIPTFHFYADPDPDPYPDPTSSLMNIEQTDIFFDLYSQQCQLKLFYFSRQCRRCKNFYVTDGNIMYLTDASRFLICCVIQHYAPVVG